MTVRMLAALTLLLAAPLSSAAAGEDTPSRDTQVNRAIITDFADLFYTRRDPAAAFAKYVAADYIQHNPRLTGGPDAALAMLVPLFSRPGATFAIKRILVDGDLAMVHIHGRPNPSEPGLAVVDIYRLKDGKIIEHWDVIQPVPETTASGRPIF